MTMKGQKQRPYDEAAAISAAARCRAMREQIGMNQEALARAARVTVRSVTRWESPDGAGYCPGDVLDMLAALVDRQRATAAVYADELAARLGKGGAAQGGPLESRKAGGSYELRKKGAAYEVGACKPGVYTEGDGGPDQAPDGPRFDAGEADSMPGGGGARDADSMPWVTLLYYPSQRCYELCHPNDSTFYGVANANARAIAQELERLGFGIEWRYATPELLEGFPFEYV